MSPATTSCMLLATGMMGQSGRRSSLDPEWIKFHGVHTTLEMERPTKGRFDTTPSCTFHAPQAFQRRDDSPFTTSSAIQGEDHGVVSGDGKVAPPCYNPSDSSRQERASVRLDQIVLPVTTTISASKTAHEDSTSIAPTNPSPHNIFTSTDTKTSFHSNRTVAILEDSTLPSHSCQSNHADSYGPTPQPPRDNELHQRNTTNTNTVDSHGEAIEITQDFSDAMLPLKRDEHPMPPLAIESETMPFDGPWNARKRGSSIAQDAEEVDGGPCSRTSLPLGLRNKKMKPTDCLLYAATLLSKVDAAAAAAHSQRTTNVSKQATAMDTTSDAPSDDPSQPRDVDVLCGRGGLINKHPGNVVYRRVVDYNKPYYQSVHKKHRILVSQSIVQSILNFGGRFLTLGAKSKSWMEIGYKRAVQKTSQALRERSVAQEDDDDEEEDEDDDDVDDDEDNGNYRKKKVSPDKHEDLDKFRWDAQTNLKKNQEIVKGS